MTHERASLHAGYNLYDLAVCGRSFENVVNTVLSTSVEMNRFVERAYSSLNQI